MKKMMWKTKTRFQERILRERERERRETPEWIGKKPLTKFEKKPHTHSTRNQSAE